MKSLGIFFLVLALCVVSIQWVSDHYRYDLYSAAIDYESSKSQLSKKHVAEGDAALYFLEGPKRAGQETIFMLHGFSADKNNWLRYARYFVDDYHVVALDLLGHGDNPTPLDRSYSIVEQVEHVRLMAAALGVERFHLVGNSMGGAISALYAATYPKQVLTATLISPAGIHTVPSLMDELIAQGTNPLIPTNLEEYKATIDFAMEQGPFIPEFVLKVEAEKSAARVEINQKIFKDLRKDLELGMQAKLKEITAPVLFIWGDQDRAVNVGNIEPFARLIPSSRKEVYEGVGHLAMIEVPERTANSALAFMHSL